MPTLTRSTRQRIRLGLVCLARKTFDFEAAADIFTARQADLAALPEVDWEVVPEQVIEVEDAQAAARQLSAAGVDGVVVISGTFHLGHLALVIDREVRRPLLLWGLNELPYNGGKIRLNSVCGVNLNASNLYKAGNDTYVCSIGDTVDQAWVDAVRMKAALERARIGVLGFRAHGFFNLAPDELRAFGEAGTLLDYYDLGEVWRAEPSATGVATREQGLRETFDCSGVTDAQVARVSRLAAAFDGFMATHRLTALAVRCWPEFALQYGVSPCAAMSLLGAEGRILACEGDAEGAMSMVAARAAGGGTPFLADLSQVDLEQDFALMWHCGVAPADLWDGCSARSLDTYFAGGKGVTADFVLKSGDISVLRIDSARGRTRLFMQQGVAEPMDKLLKGTYARVRFERPIRDLVDTVTRTGVAHHVAMVYGHHEATWRHFSRLMGWEIVR